MPVAAERDALDERRVRRVAAYPEAVRGAVSRCSAEIYVHVDVDIIDEAIQIRTLLPKIKILIFSGQAATADLLEKARAQGYEFEILAKPVHPQDLLARLRSYCRQYLEGLADGAEVLSE